MTTPLLPVIPGDDYQLKFTFTNEDGTPENQTGGSIRVMIKRKMADADGDALYDEVVNAGSPDAELGIIKAVVPKATTRVFPQKSHVYVQVRRTLGGIVQSPLLTRLEVVDSVIDDD